MRGPWADQEGARQMFMEETACPAVTTIRAMWLGDLIEHECLDTFRAAVLLTFRALDRLIAALDRVEADVA